LNPPGPWWGFLKTTSPRKFIVYLPPKPLVSFPVVGCAPRPLHVAAPNGWASNNSRARSPVLPRTRPSGSTRAKRRPLFVRRSCRAEAARSRSFVAQDPCKKCFSALQWRPARRSGGGALPKTVFFSGAFGRQLTAIRPKSLLRNAGREICFLFVPLMGWLFSPPGKTHRSRERPCFFCPLVWVGPVAEAKLQRPAAYCAFARAFLLLAFWFVFLSASRPAIEFLG